MRNASGYPVVAGVILAACGSTTCDSASVVTFNRDIAPIVWQHCAGCHRPGEAAPFALVDYGSVRRRASQIVEVIEKGVMPPWLPEPGYGEFAEERRVDPEDVARIRRWVDQGAIEGEAADLPPAPRWPEGWQLGQPDLVVELPEPYTLSGDGTDVFRNFVIPIPLRSGRYVRGLEVRPKPRGAVHHATILIDRTRASRRLDEEDAEPGYEGMFSEAARNPDSHALGWTPGKTPFFEAPGTAWRLEGGSDLVAQLHMIPSGRPELVGLSVGFFFSGTPPVRMPMDIKIGSKTIDIPAGQSDYSVEDRFLLPVDVQVLSVYPHAHYLAKDMKAFATLPDGTMRWLIWIKNWNFNWQDQYRLAKPLFLPQGTSVTMRYTYDNSADNPRNPRHPPQRVVYGPESSDEMGDLWLRLLPPSASDASILAESYLAHDLRHEIAAAEQRVAREPRAAKWHNLLGARFIEAGRVEEGIARLREAVRLKPDYPEAHNNLGHALRLTGNTEAAIAHFRQAARLAPAHDRVLFNLANALHDNGQLDEAIRHFRRGIGLNPYVADAHNNLGVVLASQGFIDEAVRHFRQALELQPEYADARRNLELASRLRRAPPSLP